MSFNAEWEDQAENWLAWARTPGHDAYWHYRSAFFELVPPAGSATLEIGCGEGRVARDLAARGDQVTGVDAAPTLLGAAAAAHAGGRYLVADAADLPFEDASFDLVVAYNSLMDVHDMPGAVREAARVPQQHGHLCVCVTHPIADAGRFAARQGDAPFVIEGSYLESRRFEGRFERDGLEMTFRGWTYPLRTVTPPAAARMRRAPRRPTAPPGIEARRPERLMPRRTAGCTVVSASLEYDGSSKPRCRRVDVRPIDRLAARRDDPLGV